MVPCSARLQYGGMAKPSPVHAGDPVLVSIGQVVRELRMDKGLSQEGLAHEAGIDRSYAGGIERGEHNITILNLLKVCRCLNVSMSELLKLAKT